MNPYDDGRTCGETTFQAPLTSYEPEEVIERTKRPGFNIANVLAIISLRLYRSNLFRPKIRGPTLHSVSLVNEMPVEIIFEILKYLHPIDLLNLYNIHMPLSQLLKSELSNFIWKSAFDDDLDLPDVPEGISGLRWAELLFGPWACQECGKPAWTLSVSFYYRLCYRCEEPMLENSQERNDDRSLCRDFARKENTFCIANESEIALQSHAHVVVPMRNIYHLRELNDIQATLLKLRAALDNNVSGAKEALDQYIDERREIVAKAKKNNRLISLWIKHLEERKSNWIDHHATRIRESATKRLLREGYPQKDIWNAFSEIGTVDWQRFVAESGLRRLTKRKWSKLRPLLEPAIKEAIRIRLIDEREYIIYHRKTFIQQQCHENQKNWLPATWISHPPFDLIEFFVSVFRVINAPHDGDLREDELKTMLDALPREVEKWHADKMYELVSMIPFLESPNSSLAVPNPLGLATSIFRCVKGWDELLPVEECLIGWDGCAPHLELGPPYSFRAKQLKFSPQGHDVASSLVRLVGLDPRTTSIWEMNDLNKRFVCTSCPLLRDHSRLVYHWTDAVSHGTSTDDNGAYKQHHWEMLGPEAEADIKSREGPDPRIWEAGWICNHCPEHFENRVTCNDAVIHAQERHDISRPVENLDYLYSARSRPPPAPAKLPIVDPREIACLRCAPTEQRLYRVKTIDSHLRNAHGIAVPVAGEDWKKISIFAAPPHIPAESL